MEIVNRLWYYESFVRSAVDGAGIALAQYDMPLYLLLLIPVFIPALIVAALKFRIKFYGILASFAMLVVSVLFTGLGFKRLIVFIAAELILAKLYCYIRSKTKNKIVYFLFLALSMAPLLYVKISAVLPLPDLAFLGVSYLSFRAIATIIEIYDGTIIRVRVWTMLYFLAFFATLSSGPIDRYRRFAEDCDKKIGRKEYFRDYLSHGIRKILMGLGYKFVLAYLINQYWLTNVTHIHSVLGFFSLAYAYILFLFFDFAGYSNFAVGTSYILGIRTPDNFKLPFLSLDMKDFWTRWHISLSQWFRDYIYSRALMNFMRKKTFKSKHAAGNAANLVTMFMMGLWHGLQPHYLVYGVYQGMALVLTDIYNRKSKFYGKHKNKLIYQLAAVFVTFNIAACGILIFSGYLFA